MICSAAEGRRREGRATHPMCTLSIHSSVHHPLTEIHGQRVPHPACIPFCGNGLHRLPHQWVLVQHTVEVVHAQREEITVRLRPDTGHPPGIRQQTYLAEVGAIRQGGSHLE